MNEPNITRPPQVTYQFVVIYNNGEILRQNYGTPEEKAFNDINLPEVREFWLEDEHGNRNFGVIPSMGVLIVAGIPISVKFPKDPRNPSQPVVYRLIYFRRIRQDFGASVGTFVKHCIGLQATIADKNYQQILLVGEDGILELVQAK